MRFGIRLTLLIMCLINLHTPAQAGDPGNNDPTGAVRDYLTALFEMDFEAAQAALCAADLAHLEADDFDAWRDEIDQLGVTVDAQALRYEIVRQGDSWARIRVTGTLEAHVAGQDEATPVTLADLKLDRFWSVVEDEAWKACSAPPQGITEALDPDGIARLFFEAAFSGDYDTAHALICDEQQAAFSEAQYTSVFSDFVDGSIQLDLEDTVFEIVEQDATSAVVDLAGDIQIHLAERPGSMVAPAENMGLGPVPFVLENDGWKICQDQPVES